MTVDYPDWTRLTQIIGTNVTIPIEVEACDITLSINITAAAIMMPVDMQAAYIMMPIDIQGQVDDMNININIKAQEITNLTIDINAQEIGIYLKADWEVLQEHDLNLDGSAACADGNLVMVLDHLVEACTTFYICQWGFNVEGNTGAKAVLFYTHNAVSTMLAESGGMVGNAQSFTKPIAVVVGDKIRVSLHQWSGGEITGHASVGGYWL